MDDYCIDCLQAECVCECSCETDEDQCARCGTCAACFGYCSCYDTMSDAAERAAERRQMGIDF